MFETAKKDKMSTHIIRQVREAILSGDLKPGECLPPEKELINQFGVSKHTLREALRTLEAMGFIEIRRGAGGGPVVSEVTMETTRDSIANFMHFQNASIHDLSEVRKIIEPYLARHAAESFAAQEVEAFQNIHQRCEKVFQQEKCLVGAKAEIDFHVFLAQHSGNPVLVMILDFVNSLLTDIKHHVKPGEEFSREVLDAHQKIVDAIVAGNADDAEKYMLEHICQVEKGLEELRLQAEAAQQDQMAS